MTEYRFSKDEQEERQSTEGKGRFARLLFDPRRIPGAYCSMLPPAKNGPRGNGKVDPPGCKALLRWGWPT
jgi:hypothetical protein